MNELIEIQKTQINGAETNSVNSRDVHEYLEVKTKYSMWIKSAIEKYDFDEGLDYIRVSQKREASITGQTTTDYIVTLDVAKELCMVSNTTKGKEIRRYFIEVEKNQKPKSPLELAKEQVRLYEALEESTKQVTHLEIVLDEANDFSSVKKQEAIHNTKFPWKPLKDYHLTHGIKLTKVFDQNYQVGVNSYSREAWLDVYGIDI